MLRTRFSTRCKRTSSVYVSRTGNPAAPVAVAEVEWVTHGVVVVVVVDSTEVGLVAFGLIRNF